MVSCPVCTRMMCDHTVVERGAGFSEKSPRVPTIGHMCDKQGGKCYDCAKFLKVVTESVPRMISMSPLAQRMILVCPSCYHVRNRRQV